MPRDQCIDQCRWKFRKYFADTVGQIDDETSCFFYAEGRHVPSEILPNFRPTLLTTRLASVVS